MLPWTLESGAKDVFIFPDILWSKLLIHEWIKLADVSLKSI